MKFQLADFPELLCDPLFEFLPSVPRPHHSCGRRVPCTVPVTTYTTDGQFRHECQQCGKSYVHNHHLIWHMKNICGQEPRFKCPYCDYRCNWKKDVLKHLQKIHKGQRAFALKLRWRVDEERIVVVELWQLLLLFRRTVLILFLNTQMSRVFQKNVIIVANFWIKFFFQFFQQISKYIREFMNF